MALTVVFGVEILVLLVSYFEGFDEGKIIESITAEIIKNTEIKAGMRFIGFFFICHTP